MIHFVRSESGDEIELPPDAVAAMSTLRSAVEHAAKGERFVFALAFPTRICILAVNYAAAASASAFSDQELCMAELLQLAECAIFLDAQLLQKAVCCRVADTLGRHDSPWSIREAFGIARDNDARPGPPDALPLAPMRSLSLNAEAARLGEDAVEMVLRECSPRTLALLSDVSASWREAVRNRHHRRRRRRHHLLRWQAQRVRRSHDFRERGWAPLAVVIDAAAVTMLAGLAGDDTPSVSFPNVGAWTLPTVVPGGMGVKEWYVGREAVAKRGILRLKRPFRRVHSIGLCAIVSMLCHAVPWLCHAMPWLCHAMLGVARRRRTTRSTSGERGCSSTRTLSWARARGRNRF